MKYIFLLIILSFSVHADYKTEEAAIEKFYLEEYVNAQNYPVLINEPPKEIHEKFRARLLNNPQEMKYFLICFAYAKWSYLNYHDRAFKLFWEMKFSGKKLVSEDRKKIIEAISNYVLADKDIAAQKKAILHFKKEANAYVKKVHSAIEPLSFK